MQDSTIVKLAEMCKDGMVYAIEQAKILAPVAWQAARMKVIADSIVWPIGFLLIALLLYSIARRLDRKYEGSAEMREPRIAIYVVALIVFIVFIISATCALHNLMCLDYLTARALWQLIN